MKPIFLLFLVSLFLISCKNNWKYQLNHPDLESKMYDRIRNVIDEDWIIESSKNELVITFCRSCSEIDSVAQKSSVFIFKEENYIKNGPDSVAYVTMVNPVMYPDDDYLKSSRKPKGILRITIRFEKPWTNQKYMETKAKNDELIEEFKRKGKSSIIKSICGDLRASIPDSAQWGEIVNNYDYYFERMPYHSFLTEKDIFIEADLPGSWVAPFYVDKKDEFYYLNGDNHMYEFYRKTMFQIGYALGIEDYKSPL